MALIIWTEAYSVGITQIDDQHKRLFSILNALYEAMQAEKDKELLDLIIKNLMDYAQMHFTIEENYFDLFNYEGKEAHKEQHRVYIGKIVEFQKNFSSDKPLLSFEVVDFLEDWILDHIREIDHQYIKCFKEHGLS